MDIIREDVSEKRRKKRLVLAAAGAVAVLLITLGLSRLKPAAPTVEKSTVWMDTVKRGPMLRQVRGPGTLVPQEIRFISAETNARDHPKPAGDHHGITDDASTFTQGRTPPSRSSSLKSTSSM